ncbi:MAG: TRAP transporter large permease [Dehalococcoidales bacterium]|nr:TRAP transporter large permease [Dehalococcoidales bacterium]
MLLLSGIPIGFSMILVGFIGLLYLANFSAALHIIGTIPYEIIGKYDYLVLPLFLLMGSICFSAGLGKSLFKFANSLLGRLPGGLAIATIGACALFAAVSSSSIATAVTIGTTSIPEMKKYKYDSAISTGCLAAGGTLGILIPPSGILIIYGIITETSIVDLFIAGIIPGIILTLLFMALVYIQSRINPTMAPPGPRTTLIEKLKATTECIEVILLIILVVGGLYIGWFTPTEAGGIAAIGSIVVSLVRRRLNWHRFKEALGDTIRTTGMIFMIMIGAFIMNTFIALSAIPQELADLVAGFDLPSVMVIILVVFVYLILGCFIDTMSMIVLTVPVFSPLVVLGLGYDPVWFGIIVVVVTEMAMVTPPIGINVFIIASIDKDVPMQVIFRGIIPFVAGEMALVFLLIAFPQIVMYL